MVSQLKIDTIRVSKGTAITLNLLKAKQLVPPTNAYFMSSRGCQASCKFCSQSRESQSHDKLSRITWPKFPFEETVSRLKQAYLEKKVRRVCLQVTNHSHFFDEIVATFSSIAKHSKIPLSVSSPPLSLLEYQELYEIGVRHVSVSLDGSTPAIFNKIKGKDANGPYTWEKHWKALHRAGKVFGTGNVTSHLIIGVGETEQEAISLIDKLLGNGVITALFAFTPLKNTPLENRKPPNVIKYRKIQLARYLITNKGYSASDFSYENQKVSSYNIEKSKLNQIIKSGTPFLTTGCPDCNRPFYNESVRGPWYNFPRQPTDQECLRFLEELKEYV